MLLNQMITVIERCSIGTKGFWVTPITVCYHRMCDCVCRENLSHWERIVQGEDVSAWASTEEAELSETSDSGPVKVDNWICVCKCTPQQHLQPARHIELPVASPTSCRDGRKWRGQARTNTLRKINKHAMLPLWVTEVSALKTPWLFRWWLGLRSTLRGAQNGRQYFCLWGRFCFFSFRWFFFHFGPFFRSCFWRSLKTWTRVTIRSGDSEPAVPFILLCWKSCTQSYSSASIFGRRNSIALGWFMILWAKTFCSTWMKKYSLFCVELKTRNPPAAHLSEAKSFRDGTSYVILIRVSPPICCIFRSDTTVSLHCFL